MQPHSAIIRADLGTPEPVPADPMLADALDLAHSRLDNGELVGGLPAETRTAFNSRLAVVSRSLVPAPVEAFETPIAVLLASFFLARGVSPTEAEVTTRAYAMTMEGLPLWAVTRACKAIARGEVSGISKDFPPAAPRIREVAAEQMERLVAESFRLHRVLNAHEVPQPSPEEQERIKTKFAVLKARLSSGAFKTMPAVAAGRTDGNHGKRIAADLAARKARNAMNSGGVL